MQKIRKAVEEDKSLSVYAHNVKIISENGKVTLKGPVRSEAESQNIETKALNVAGADNVDNRLSIESFPALHDKQPANFYPHYLIQRRSL